MVGIFWVHWEVTPTGHPLASGAEGCPSARRQPPGQRICDQVHLLRHGKRYWNKPPPWLVFETSTLCHVEQLSLSEAPVGTEELWDSSSPAEALKVMGLWPRHYPFMTILGLSLHTSRDDSGSQSWCAECWLAALPSSSHPLPAGARVGGMEAGGLWSWWGRMVRTGLRFGAEPLSASCCNTENHMAILAFDFGWRLSDLGSQLAPSDEKIKDLWHQTGCWYHALLSDTTRETLTSWQEMQLDLARPCCISNNVGTRARTIQAISSALIHRCWRTILHFQGQICKTDIKVNVGFGWGWGGHTWM